jgi:hypothetical protein
VTSVSHQNGHGKFHIRSYSNHKKLAAANGAGLQTPVGQEFHVTPMTRFGYQNGNPASFASLHRGERVRVQAVAHQAGAVQIISNHRVPGSFTRYRPSVYRPHIYRTHPIYYQHHSRRRF